MPLRSLNMAKKSRRRITLVLDRNTRLIKLREQFFPSARKAALHMGMSYPRYVKYETGERQLTKDAAEHIAPYFKTTAALLLYGEQISHTGQKNSDPRSNLSLFLTNDLAYFNKIVTGQYPESPRRLMIGHVELPPRVYCVHQPDRSMLPGNAADTYRWPAIPPGADVIFDPDAECHPDDVVHAIITSRADSVIRIMQRYRAQDGTTRTRLAALNSSFEAIDLDEDSGDAVVGKYLGQLQVPRAR